MFAFGAYRQAHLSYGGTHSAHLRLERPLPRVDLTGGCVPGFRLTVESGGVLAPSERPDQLASTSCNQAAFILRLGSVVGLPVKTTPAIACCDDSSTLDQSIES